MNPLRLAQLSDCHVSADPATSYRGQSADENLASVVRSVMEWSADAILLTGDVSEDASPESYRRVGERLSECGLPVWALPGNHDDPDVMAGFFEVGPWRQPRCMEMENWRIVLLDSTERGRISGVLDSAHLEWLRNDVAASPDSNYLLALHHQPLPVGAPWIDRYRLETPGPLLEMAEQADNIRCIVWGHIHHEFQHEQSGTLFLGAPSTVANSLPGTEKFTLDPNGPSARWLELHEDGRVTTGVLGGS